MMTVHSGCQDTINSFFGLHDDNRAQNGNGLGGLAWRCAFVPPAAFIISVCKTVWT